MDGYSKSYYIQKRTDLCIKICRSLYRSVHGRVASVEYQKKVADMKDPTLTFGEIVPQSFLQILNFTVKMDEPAIKFMESCKEGRKFVDLGSGTGRACLCAALSPYNFYSIVGVELMPALCDQSNEVLNSLKLLVQSAGKVPVSQPSSTGKMRVVTPIAANSLDKTAVIVLQELSATSESVAMDYFANHLTKRLGHKVFKAAIKEHKSFSRYVINKPALFTLSHDSKTIKLAKLLLEEGERSREDCHEAEVEEDNDSLKVSSSECASALISNDFTRTFSHTSTEHGHNTISSSSSCPSTSATLVGGEALLSGSYNVAEDTSGSNPPSELKSLQLTSADAALVNPLPDISFHCGDMFQYDWSDADVVYAASLLFSTPMMEKLTVQAAKLKPGSWVISLKPLLLEECAVDMKHSLELRTAEWYKMSWQMAKVFIYQVVCRKRV